MKSLNKLARDTTLRIVNGQMAGNFDTVGIIQEALLEAALMKKNQQEAVAEVHRINSELFDSLARAYQMVGVQAFEENPSTDKLFEVMDFLADVLERHDNEVTYGQEEEKVEEPEATKSS